MIKSCFFKIAAPQRAAELLKGITKHLETIKGVCLCNNRNPVKIKWEPILRYFGRAHHKLYHAAALVALLLNGHLIHFPLCMPSYCMAPVKIAWNSSAQC